MWPTFGTLEIFRDFPDEAPRQNDLHPISGCREIDIFDGRDVQNLNLFRPSHDRRGFSVDHHDALLVF
jgi:hypothetical protein